MKSKNGKSKKLNTTSAVVFGYFWRYGAIVVGLALTFLLAFLTHDESAVLFALAGTMAIVGLEYIIATALRMPHIYVVYASACHRTDAWRDIRQNESDAAHKEMYKVGGILLGFGVLIAGGNLIIIFFG